MSQMKEMSEMARPGDPALREGLEFWEKLQPDSAAEFFDAVRKEASKEGLEKGLEKGRKETCLKIAERLLGQGVADSDIQVATQLSLEEIGSLRNGGLR